MQQPPTRKEKLALYQQQKLLNKKGQSTTRSGPAPTALTTKAAPAGSIRGKIQKAAKTTLLEGKAQSAKNAQNVVLAGKKKIGASTPIGKLQARLKSKSTTNPTSHDSNKCSKKLFEPDSPPISKVPCTAQFNKIIEMKLDEAEYLNKKHGCHVARAYLEELPKDDECSHLELLSKAVYWLTWIKIEQGSHQWERVEKLFIQAASLVRSAVDKKVIAAAYEDFRNEADNILESKMECITNMSSVSSTLDSNSTSVPSFVPKVDSTQCSKRKYSYVEESESEATIKSSPTTSENAFSHVDVTKTRNKFENGFSQEESSHSQQLGLGKIDVKKLSQVLVNNMASTSLNAKNLAGAVALPGMLRRPDTTQAISNLPPMQTKADDLSNLLGLGNDDEDEHVDECETAEEIVTNDNIPRQSKLNKKEDNVTPNPSAVLNKKVCRSRAPVRISNKGNDIFSDSEDEQETQESNKENKIEEVVQVSENISNSCRKTRSGVCFNDQNYKTPSKNSGNARKKRKCTPFKPDIKDIILSP